MALILPPPPTWAQVIVRDEKTQQESFNPVWLDWFIRVVAAINGSGGSTVDHNTLTGLQGGIAGQFYHLSSVQRLRAIGNYTTASSGIVVGASPFTYTNGSALYDAGVIVEAGTVTQVDFKRGATTTNTGVIAGMFQLSPGDQLIVTYAVAPNLTLIQR